MQRTWWRRSHGRRRRTGASDLCPFPLSLHPTASNHACIPSRTWPTPPETPHRQHRWAQGRAGARQGCRRGGSRRQYPRSRRPLNTPTVQNSWDAFKSLKPWHGGSGNTPRLCDEYQWLTFLSVECLYFVLFCLYRDFGQCYLCYRLLRNWPVSSRWSNHKYPFWLSRSSWRVNYFCLP